MIIVSQEKDLILNFENIDAIGIGNPLENDDGMFKILANTTSDNEYTLGKYKTKKRTKEILEDLMNTIKGKVIYSCDNQIIQTLDNKIYEMPKED